MITRETYMKNYSAAADRTESRRLYREYTAQFVTEGIRAMVARIIGVGVLLASKDEHLNDIPLGRWDKMVLPSSVNTKLKECGDYLTMAGRVSILKEAARQLIESHNAKKGVA